VTGKAVQMATVGQVRAVVERLDRAGVLRSELATALGKNRQGTISDWLAKPDDFVTRQPLAELERVAAALTRPARPEADARTYAAGLFVTIEADLRHALAKVAQARTDLGLTATPSRVPAADQGVRAHLSPAPSGGARRRKRG